MKTRYPQGPSLFTVIALTYLALILVIVFIAITLNGCAARDVRWFEPATKDNIQKCRRYSWRYDRGAAELVCVDPRQ